jgi:hypothetical protein
MEKKSRVEFLYENSFKATYRKAVKRGQLTKFDNRHEGFTSLHHMVYNNPEDLFYDYRLFSFLSNMGISPTDYLGEEKTPREVAFNFLVECDPTPNKENLQWLLGLYKNQLISYTPTDSDSDTNINNNFYEDLYTTVKSSLETFAFLKKTNVLAESKRDINKYPDYQTINEVVLPYMMMGDEGEDNVHTLDTKELRCIQNHQNFIEKNKEYDESVGRAELVFENKDWVIVVTHDKPANIEFGKYTTWCTAGTRYGSMFESYHGRGELFVLVKKGYGSKQAIKKDASVRLQFHFEDQQYMDAPDRPISINDFLFKNPEIKNFFKKYITKTVLPKRQKKGKVNDDIQFLLKLGYGDEIIKMLKESKPKVLDFSGNKMDYNLLSEIGDIDSLEKLDFSDCSLSQIPDSIQNLKKLKYLKLRNNDIEFIPDWLNKLTSLTFLDLSGCNIKNRFDLTGLSNVTDVVLDYNRRMTDLPTGLETLNKLARLTASNCSLKKVEESILNCPELFLVDFHGNKNLTKIPANISGMENIIAICIDDTGIDNDLMKALKASRRSNDVSIIKYDS